MNQVSCRASAVIIRSLVARGVDPAHPTRGAGVDLETLEDESARISWSAYLRVLENTAELFGGPDGLEELSAAFYPQSDGLLRSLASQLVSPRALYHMGARWYGPWLYPCTRAECEDLPDGRIRQVIRILPDYEDSETFFHAMSGGMRTVPALLGLPASEVEMERAPRQATYTIKPPAIGRIARLRRLLPRRGYPLAGVEAELSTQFDELQKSFECARAMSAELAETSRRLEAERLERERIEQMLQQAQKLDAMGRLAGGIAHDFNNVLTAISGYAELALDQLDEEHPVHADVAEIQEVTERGAALVQQLLGFSRRQQIRPQQLELNALLIRMETLLKRLLPESIELEIVPHGEPLPLVADPGQVEQVVINLVINSRDAMPGGGRVRIELTHREDDALGTVARLVVSDTGRGMDEQTAARAFEPFFTTKARNKGTGIGLGTVQGIVSGAGGRIDLASRVGEGTEVTIDWPVAQAVLEPGEAAPADDGPPLGGTETVLVVEDDDEVRGVIERILAAAGYTVLSASESHTALDLARNHPRAIELLVADAGLPGDEGEELAERISDLRAELRGALLLSAQAGEGAQAAGAANLSRITKPVDRPALLRAARRILDA
ncbi:MAG: ATP-binding protein [Myxococcota bacterium]